MALSLGPTRDAVQLGAPLQLRFAVQPDADKTTASSCLQAQVWFGDQLLDSHQVRLSPQAQTVHVRTQAIVNEPLVTVQLRGGCAGSVARSYTFFADPPAALAATVTPIDLDSLQAVPIAVAASAGTSARPSPRPAPARPPARPAKKPVVAAASGAATSAAVASPTPAAPAAPSSEATPAAAAADTPASTATAADASPPAIPHLRMEPLELSDPAQVSASADSGSGSGSADDAAPISAQTQALLDANTQRMVDMEQQLLQMQIQLTGSRAEMLRLHQQLLQAQQNQGLPAWVYALPGLLALALACIAWLVQRLRQERQRLQQAWANTVLDIHDSEGFAHEDTVPAQPSPVQPARSVQPQPLEAARQPGALASASAQFTAEAPPAHALQDILTAQALLDIQEQADFYASIGEHDQAIDILQTHLSQHASTSPQAYLELLQLLCRLGRTEAFAHACTQMQQHFNVQLPAFAEFATSKGAPLRSAYPDLYAQLQSVWHSAQAVPVLHSWIVGGPSAPAPLSLAAFEEALMLYNTAHGTSDSQRAPLDTYGQPQHSYAANALPQATAVTTTNFLPEAPFNALPVASSIAIPLSTASLESLSVVHGPNTSPARATELPGTATPPSVDSFLLHDLSLQWPESADAPSPASELALDTLDERDLPPPPADAMRQPH